VGVNGEPELLRDPAEAKGAEPSLTARVVRGAAWVFAGKMVGRGLDLVRLVVLARLLSPADFGLFGIVMLAIAALQTFTRTGFDTALIQRKAGTEAYLDTVWTVQVVRALALAAILFSAAPLVGWFFGDPRAVPLLRVMCVSVVLGGLANIGVIYFRKDLEFHKQFVYSFVPAVISVAVGVVLAYRLRSVWALLWAGMAGAATRCLLSYAIHPFRPGVRFDRAQAAELFRFGRWVLLSSALLFLITHGDDVFVGKVLGVAALGLYQMAYRASNMAATEITHTISSVTFPSYSRIQDDVGRFRGAYLSVLASTMFLAMPVAVGTAAIAPTLIRVVLGAKWSAAIIPTQVLCVFGLARAYGATTGPVFYGSGTPKHLTYAALIQLGLMVPLIWPATSAFGLAGTCVAVTAPMLVAQCYASLKVSRVLSLSMSELLLHMALPVIPSLAMLAAVLGAASCMGESLPALCALVLLGMLAYAATAALVIRSTGAAGVAPIRRVLLGCARAAYSFFVRLRRRPR